MTTDRAALEKAIRALRGHDHRGHVAHFALVLEAASAHLDTLPRTKMVEVWRVEWAGQWDAHARRAQGPAAPRIENFVTREKAEQYERDLRAQSDGMWSCIKVTGPHLQEVPST